MSLWSKIWYGKGNDWVFAKLDTAQAPNGGQPDYIEKDEDYVSIVLKSMRVPNVRKGSSEFYGATYAHTSLLQRDQQHGDFTSIVVPSQLQLADSKRLDRVLSLNHRIFGPVPYCGGDLKIEIGLFSIKENELARPFLNLLEKISTIAPLAPIAAAMPMAHALLEGIETIASVDQTILEVGVHRSFQQIVTGTYAVIACDKADIKIDSLQLDPNDYKLVAPKGSPIKDSAYFIFEIVKDKHRPEWRKLPEIEAKYAELQGVARDGKYNEAKELLTVLKRYLLSSNGLQTSDAQAIHREIEKKTNLVLGSALTRGGTKRGEMPAIEALNPFGSE
jgi:hypothetical protein